MGGTIGGIPSWADVWDSGQFRYPNECAKHIVSSPGVVRQREQFEHSTAPEFQTYPGAAERLAERFAAYGEMRQSEQPGWFRTSAFRVLMGVTEPTARKMKRNPGAAKWNRYQMNMLLRCCLGRDEYREIVFGPGWRELIHDDDSRKKAVEEMTRWAEGVPGDEALAVARALPSLAEILKAQAETLAKSAAS